MTQKPHYEVEDVPPQDTDTKVQLFEQAAETVKDAVLVAQQIRDDAEKVLGGIYDSAEKAGDTALANRVNDAWEHVQSLATVAARQGAALRGASGAMSAIKEQRDRVLEELNGIKDALDNHDTTHDALVGFVESLEEEWNVELEYFDFGADVQGEISFTLINVVGLDSVDADAVITLLRDEFDTRDLTDEQIDLLKQLAQTLDEDYDEEESDE